MAGVLILRAYLNTSYVVVRGKTRAFNLPKSRSDHQGAVAEVSAPDSYSGITSAPKTWWLIVVVTSACTLMVVLFVISREGPWYAASAALTICLVAVVIGHQDGSWQYPIARGQLVQLVIAGVTTAGIFTVLYFFAYAAGKRWPLRPKGTMDYRAHPHLRKKFPK